MDLLHQGTHMGGTISPGLQMRLASMAQGTANLPQPSLEDVTTDLGQATAMGINTNSALLAGAVGGMAAEIQGRWAALRQEVPNLGPIHRRGLRALGTPRHPPEIRRRPFDPERHHALLQHFHDVC